MADMQPSEAPLLAACLAQLRAVAVEWQDVSPSREFDGTLIVRLGPRRTVRFPVEVKRTPASSSPLGFGFLGLAIGCYSAYPQIRRQRENAPR